MDQEAPPTRHRATDPGALAPSSLVVAAPDPGGRVTSGATGTSWSRPAWRTVLAFGAVAVPFAVAVGRLVASPGAHLALPDDLALIDLHTRRALGWHQQLGVFDRNNWNHPGPTYFYLLSLAYRAFGSGARSLFIGATLLNGLAALGCVWVVRRRTSPTRTLWAALWVCLLATVMATTSPGSSTYSEGPLGAVESPWNPMVVIFPLLLLFLLCASAIDRSALSLLGAALVGSFVVQTDIAVLPIAVVFGIVAGMTWVVTALADRRSALARMAHAPDPPPVAADGGGRRGVSAWRGRAVALAGLVVLVLMWLPPILQQLTNHPGNITLIYRFFASPHQGHSLPSSVRSVVAAFGVVVVGPSEIMSSLLGGTPHHAAAAAAVAVATVVLGVVTTVVGVRQRTRFAAGLGVLTLAGCVASLFAASHVVGFVFGYLMVWAVVVPIGACIGVGMVRLPAHIPPRPTGAPGYVLGALTIVVAAVLMGRMVALPTLDTVSDPHVARLFALVAGHLDRNGTVFVGDAGAGTRDTRLFDTEEFIGLVNQLDQHGYHPTVNHLWRPQFGPRYVTTGHETRQIQLSTWTPASARVPGYVGRVGDIAVVVTPPAGSQVVPVAVSAHRSVGRSVSGPRFGAAIAGAAAR